MSLNSSMWWRSNKEYEVEYEVIPLRSISLHTFAWPYKRNSTSNISTSLPDIDGVIYFPEEQSIISPNILCINTNEVTTCYMYNIEQVQIWNSKVIVNDNWNILHFLLTEPLLTWFTQHNRECVKLRNSNSTKYAIWKH